ncbi:MAG: trypsin-like serine protease, partial [Sphingomonas sp.]|nr:trypsin-like serine protease [Sphingomonas sp.]
MRATRFLILTTALGLVATGASAASYSITGLAQKNMTYTSVAGAQAALVSNGGYSGVGSLFVSHVSTATTGFGSLCTGSLVNSTTVLTAAHCLYDHDEAGNADPVTGITFFLPSFGERHAADVVTISASDWAFNPLYDNADHSGDIGSGHDVGGVTSDYEKRTGTNLYELYGDDLFSDVSHGVVLSDFDDGTTAHDVFGRNLGLTQTGINGEADSSPGDSGGPEFINGKIASVTSFGITGGIFNGYCGGGSTDPFNKNGSATPTALSGCTNS